MHEEAHTHLSSRMTAPECAVNSTIMFMLACQYLTVPLSPPYVTHAHHHTGPKQAEAHKMKRFTVKPRSTSRRYESTTLHDTPYHEP